MRPPNRIGSSRFSVFSINQKMTSSSRLQISINQKLCLLESLLSIGDSALALELLKKLPEGWAPRLLPWRIANSSPPELKKKHFFNGTTEVVEFFLFFFNGLCWWIFFQDYFHFNFICSKGWTINDQIRVTFLRTQWAGFYFHGGGSAGFCSEGARLDFFFQF